MKIIPFIQWFIISSDTSFTLVDSKNLLFITSKRMGSLFNKDNEGKEKEGIVYFCVANSQYFLNEFLWVFQNEKGETTIVGFFVQYYFEANVGNLCCSSLCNGKGVILLS